MVARGRVIRELLEISIIVVSIVLCVPDIPHQTRPGVWANNLLIQWVLGILLRVVPGRVRRKD